MSSQKDDNPDIREIPINPYHQIYSLLQRFRQTSKDQKFDQSRAALAVWGHLFGVEGPTDPNMGYAVYMCQKQVLAARQMINDQITEPEAYNNASNAFKEVEDLFKPKNFFNLNIKQVNNTLDNVMPQLGVLIQSLGGSRVEVDFDEIREISSEIDRLIDTIRKASIPPSEASHLIDNLKVAKWLLLYIYPNCHMGATEFTSRMSGLGAELVLNQGGSPSDERKNVFQRMAQIANNFIIACKVYRGAKEIFSDTFPQITDS